MTVDEYRKVIYSDTTDIVRRRLNRMRPNRIIERDGWFRFEYDFSYDLSSKKTLPLTLYIEIHIWDFGKIVIMGQMGYYIGASTSIETETNLFRVTEAIDRDGMAQFMYKGSYGVMDDDNVFSGWVDLNKDTIPRIEKFIADFSANIAESHKPLIAQLNPYTDGQRESNTYNVWLDGPFEFGRYPFYEDGGVKPITWIPKMLNGDNKMAILISEYILDVKPLNTAWENTNWPKCSLRRWLNTEFLNTAFTKEEQNALIAPFQPEGNDTRVFIPTHEDILNLFRNKTDRQCKYTPYSMKQGLWTGSESEAEYGHWWSGSIFIDRDSLQCFSPIVYASGDFDETGRNALAVDYDDIGVRPLIVLRYEPANGNPNSTFGTITF